MAAIANDPIGAGANIAKSDSFENLINIVSMTFVVGVNFVARAPFSYLKNKKT